MVWFWLILSATLNAIGEYFSKLWANSPLAVTAVLAIGSYTLGSIAWLPALKAKNILGVTGVMWLVLGLIATIALSAVVFKERLTIQQWVGIALGFLSVFLLNSK